ncbi:hypothetical protein LP415_18520 [Polaromonas sp. P1(28)-8]|nr:hypothetical protein LP415_18520 [Polaromonas sp. P1(28)-8]
MEQLPLSRIKIAFETQGMTPTHSTPEEFSRLMAVDAERWAWLVKAHNIQAN